MIPSGFATNSKKGMPAVTDDIWLDFADGVYAKWVLAIPDLAESKVKIRVTPTGLDQIDNLTISARVKPWPDGQIIGEAKTNLAWYPPPTPSGANISSSKSLCPTSNPGRTKTAIST